VLSRGLLGTAVSVWGLLPMLQALKDARRACIGSLMVKGARIAKRRYVQVIGFNVQFAGQATSFGPVLATIGIARFEMAAAVDGSTRPPGLYRGQPPLCAENLPSTSLTSSGMWSVR
jgi:hypothetical protein